MSAEIPMLLWTEAEEARLRRDREEVASFAPDLTFIPPGQDLAHGGWMGVLPVWPFDREPPERLNALVPTGLEFVLEYPTAYPMVAPTIHPVSPEPELMERTQGAWHVLPSGGLCLLRSDGAWLPEASVVELLVKAAGWRVEYALMKAGVIDAMSVEGIVSNPEFDPLVARAVRREMP